MTYPQTAGFKREGTSSDAATAIQPKLSKRRKQVLEAFQFYGPMTADECAARLNLSVLSVRPRCSELVKMNYLFETGTRRKNESGMSAEVLEA